MNGVEQEQNVDLSVDKNNLYRQEVITDFKLCSITTYIPLNPDGTEDKSRTVIFLGQTQVMSPQGPTPIQARLEADNLEEAIDAFPEAMKQAVNQAMTQMAESYSKVAVGAGAPMK
ncbi:MAG: cytoplasmic protein [Deltaproteobacteria bacterium]|nr:cytoplasmic protein [Deltaproteobacteria bacterium]